MVPEVIEEIATEVSNTIYYVETVITEVLTELPAAIQGNEDAVQEVVNVVNSVLDAASTLETLLSEQVIEAGIDEALLYSLRAAQAALDALQDQIRQAIAQTAHASIYSADIPFYVALTTEVIERSEENPVYVELVEALEYALDTFTEHLPEPEEGYRHVVQVFDGPWDFVTTSLATNEAWVPAYDAEAAPLLQVTLPPTFAPESIDNLFVAVYVDGEMQCRELEPNWVPIAPGTLARSRFARGVLEGPEGYVQDGWFFLAPHFTRFAVVQVASVQYTTPAFPIVPIPPTWGPGGPVVGIPIAPVLPVPLPPTWTPGGPVVGLPVEPPIAILPPDFVAPPLTEGEAKYEYQPAVDGGYSFVEYVLAGNAAALVSSAAGTWDGSGYYVTAINVPFEYFVRDGGLVLAGNPVAANHFHAGPGNSTVVTKFASLFATLPDGRHEFGVRFYAPATGAFTVPVVVTVNRPATPPTVIDNRPVHPATGVGPIGLVFSIVLLAGGTMAVRNHKKLNAN